MSLKQSGDSLGNMRRLFLIALLLPLAGGLIVFLLYASERIPLAAAPVSVDRYLQPVLIVVYALAYYFGYRVNFKSRIAGLRRSRESAAQKLELFHRAIVPLWMLLGLLGLLGSVVFILTLNLAYLLLALFTLFFLLLLAPAPGRVSILLGEPEQEIRKL